MKPIKNRCVVNVGITGSRNIGEAEIPYLTDFCSSILEWIRGKSEDSFSKVKHLYTDEPIKFQLVNCLAEGFDRIAANAAVIQGYSLLAVLPYSRDDYTEDFASDESKSEYNHLLDQAESVFELDFGRESSERVYMNAGVILLEHTDILVACWDGKPAKGPGGTGDVVELARDMGIPVVYINPKRQIIFDKSHNWETRLASSIESLIVPNFAADGNQAFPEDFFREETDTKKGIRLYSRVLRLFSPKTFPNAEEDGKTSRESAQLVKAKKYYSPYFTAADSLAVQYAECYRSAGMLRAIIPLLANIALAVGFYWRWGETNIVNIIGFIAQVVLLYWMVRVVGERNEKNKWHQKFVDYRILSESLRYQPYIITVGDTLQGIGINSFGSEDNVSWVNWYLRGVIRGYGLPRTAIGKESLCLSVDTLKAELQGQIEYHSKSSDKTRSVHKTVERWGIGLFTAGALVTVIRVLVHFACQLDPNLTWIPDLQHKWIKLPTFMNMLSLLLPAFGATLFAIGVQGAWDKLNQRHKQMKSQISEIIEDSPNEESITFPEAKKWISNTVELLINEVSDWRMFIKSKGISKR